MIAKRAMRGRDLFENIVWEIFRSIMKVNAANETLKNLPIKKASKGSFKNNPRSMV